MATAERMWVRPTNDGHRVTTLELFFDLVFVFGFTQVTQFIATDLDFRSVVRGSIMLAVLWFAWCCYSWLGNQAKADEGVVRLALLTSAAAMFIAALAIPDAWNGSEGGFNASLLIAVAVTVVRLVHLGVYWIAAVDDAGLRRQLRVTSVPGVLACALLIGGALAGGSMQTVLWGTALVVDYAGIYLVGAEGWRVISPVHFAERYGLIIIVALGESIISVGLGIYGSLSWAVVAAALAAFVITVCMWWMYFDVVALVAERALHHKQGVDRSKMARDSYTYLHFPMVVGIIFMALGFKKTLTYVSDETHYELTEALHGIALYALFGGVALYLLAHVAFRLRNIGTLNRHRLALVAAITALVPVGAHMPALASIWVIAGLLSITVAYETNRYRDARREVRHGGAAGGLEPKPGV
jgi:low temperature requirement protein LtrA